MDDFFTEMRSVLKDIKTSNLASETHDSTSILQTYFPNMFAEALVPLNPIRWPSFIAGSALSSEMPELGDQIKTPFENLVVAKEYLETSQSDVQWRDRFWKVTEDTAIINFSCELGKENGAFYAGVLSNKMADNYMNEMVETSLTLTNEEKLNDQIFRLRAQDQGIDPTSVRGTGVIREFVPDYMKGDLCDRPERNARPFDDDYGQGLLEDGIILNSKNNDFGPSGDSVFESSSSTVENQKDLFSRFCDFFGPGSDQGMCPAPAYEYTDSTLLDKFCDLFGFFVPESGGVYYCNDPSKMMPPSPFLGDFFPDSDS